MLKNWLRDIALMVQARSGVTTGFFFCLAIVALAALTAFVFLCVAGYDWFAMKAGPVFAGLIMAGIFVVIALIVALIAAMARRRARERAILARAARAHSSSSWLLDPKILSVAVQAGRTLGWQRLVPVALLGFMAAQWAREYRARNDNDADTEAD